jgi:hypothetical protein
MIKLFLKTLLILLPSLTFGQQFFRVSTDFSIMEKNVDGSSSLTRGRMYFDKTNNKLVYDINFPKQETVVITNDFVYKYENNQLMGKEDALGLLQFHVLYLIVQGDLATYGLKNSVYVQANVTREDDMVITTWQPNEQLKDKLGDILMATKRKRLHGLVFKNIEERVLSKQFFDDYTNIRGLEMPTKITQIFYTESGENYSITQFKNIVTNEMGKDEIYNYPISQ